MRVTSKYRASVIMVVFAVLMGSFVLPGAGSTASSQETLFAGRASAKTKVEAPVKTPKVLVKVREAGLTDARIKADKKSPSGFTFYARIQNKSEKKRIKKAVLTYRISYKKKVKSTVTGSAAEVASGSSVDVVSGSSAEVVSGSSATPVSGSSVSPVSGSSTVVEKKVSRTVTLTARGIKPGKKSATLSCIADGSGTMSSMKCLRIEVYAGEAVHIQDRVKKTTTREWVGEDKKAPVFKGLQMIGSMINGLPCLTVYSDKRNDYDYTQLIRVKDNRDPEPKITVDKSKIDFERTGWNKVHFTATDSSGNTSKSWSYVQVIVPGDLESYMDQILSGIIRESDSEKTKVRAIYKYITGHIAYVSDGDHGYWHDVASNGLLFGTGDCYTYYAAAHALLSRAGITEIMVKRYPNKPGMNHWWNLIHFKDKWYHFESMPHGSFDLCLVTTRQLQSSIRGYFRFDWRLYPKIAKKRLHSILG